MVVLIDNCTLLQLVASNGYSKFLIDLENSIHNRSISLLTHPHILEEWKKHKERDLRRKERKLLGEPKQAQNQNNLLPSKLPAGIPYLNIQYSQIDALLAKAIILETPQIIKNEFSDRYRHRMAPFHKKLNGQNDWEIFGSAGLYCEHNNLPQLYFLSDNYTDFADPDEPTSKIHPQLQERFPDLEISYFRLLTDFFAACESPVIPHRMLEGTILKSQKYSYKSSLRKHPLESLHYVFESLYEELAYVPIHILSTYAPFSDEGKAQPHYFQSTLSYVSSKLMELLEYIEVDPVNGITIIDECYFKGVHDYKHKIERVLLRLTHNLIFYVEGNGSSESKSVFFDHKDRCDCVKCLFYRLEFTKLVNALKILPVTIEDKLRHAFIQYQLGNFGSSAELFLQIRNQAYQDKKYIWYFISIYNLKHLGIYLSNAFFGQMSTDPETKNLNNIDILEKCVILKGHSDYNLLSFIARNEFFTWALDKISQEVNNIMDHYYSQLNGGWGNNSHVWHVADEFSTLDVFLSTNFVIYDGYSNFSKLFDLVTKGLLASHAMNEKQPSRWQRFDDYWVTKFIMYGTKKVILKYFNRFKLKSIEYKKSSEDGNFITLAANLFTDSNNFPIQFAEIANVHNDFFSSKYYKYFENVLTMGTILNLSQEDLNRFATDLYKYLKTNGRQSYRILESLNTFLRAKGKALPQTLVLDYWRLFIKETENPELKILASLLSAMNEITKKKITVKVLFGHLLGNKKTERGFTDLETIIPMFTHAPIKEKQDLSAQVNKKLEEGFNKELFYLSTIVNIIPLNKRLLFKEIDAINCEPEQKPFFDIWGEENHRIKYLDQLINICFKFNINTRTKRFERFKKIHQYYEWLLDMDGFNYQNFHLDWVNTYGTAFYFKRMSGSKKLNQFLKDYLKRNSDIVVEKAFAKIHLDWKNEIG